MPARKPKTPRTRDQLVAFDATSDEGKERMIGELGRRGTDVETRVGAIEAQAGTFGNIEARMDTLEAEVDSIITSGPVPASRAINTTAPLSGGGDLSADRTLSLSGRVLLGRQVFTASGTYTPTSGTKAVRLRMVGGGGGGGGAGGGAAARSAGGGGSSGAYLEHWIIPGVTITGGSVTIGSGGSAGSSAGGNGGNGTDSSVVIQGVTYTAKGGTGNAGLAVSAGYTQSVNPQAGSTTVDIVAGGAGTAALTHGGGTNVIAGNGGSNPLGYGGVTPTDSAGVAGTGYGAGGSGGLHNGSTDRAGGAGTAGVVIIEEYA